MFALFFLPFFLIMEVAMFPLRVMLMLLRRTGFLAALVVFGLFSMVGGMIRHMLPLVLIGVGLWLIYGAYVSAKAKKEGTEVPDIGRAFRESTERVRSYVRSRV